MRYKALAYIGLVWLSDLGTYDTREDAKAILEIELERQQDNNPDENWDELSESFWANSQIDEV